MPDVPIEDKQKTLTLTIRDSKGEVGIAVTVTPEQFDYFKKEGSGETIKHVIGRVLEVFQLPPKPETRQ